MRHGFPQATRGLRVGLLGGSFDPAHGGHVHITREALKRFGLDRVWWLVTPGNPLKASGPAPMERRIKLARELMQHPRVVVTDLEARLKTAYTAETLAGLQAIYPDVRFVWLMGADNLADFHRWDRWRTIMERVPIGVVARPGQRIAARTSKAAQVYAHARVKPAQAYGLAEMRPPAWTFVNVPMTALSSTEIRKRGEW